MNSPADTLPSVTLKKRRAQPFLNRHPWVFTGAIASVEGNPQPGNEVIVNADDGRFVARGLFNSNSNIRVRLYSWDQDIPLDSDFWSARIEEAVAARDELIDRKTNSAFRLINSEADGISGLIVDRYDEWLIVQLTSLALAERREHLLDLLEARCRPKGIHLRTDRGIRAAEGLELSDGLIRGEAAPRPLVIHENGLPFHADIAEGQKTGSYLDQRENRLTVSRYVKGHRVLDLFCYSGGFGITAAKLGDAKSVMCVDSSEPALELARSNAQLNSVDDRVTFERSEVFRLLESLRDQKQQFDTVILDPPKMARHQKGVASALRGYRSLNELATSLIRPGGLLVTCSCSGHISRIDIESMLSNVAASVDRRIQILESRGHAPDHPVSPNCPENEYLQCLICRVV